MSDPGRVFGPDGAIEALVAARKAGKIRFIGFTGHKSPAIHLKMLEAAAAHRFTFDTVQMPLNVMDAHYDSFEQPGAARADEARHRRAGDEAARLGAVPAQRAARRAAGHADRVPAVRDGPADLGGDHRLRDAGDLMQALDAAYGWQPMSERGPEGAPRPHRAGRRPTGEWEKYKTSDRFDGTARNPHWLETAKL